MEFYPIDMRCDYMKSEYAVTAKEKPLFSWGAFSSQEGAFQKAFRIEVCSQGECLWDSGVIESSEQSVVYGGKELKSGALYEWTLSLTDNYSNISQEGKGFFKTACLGTWKGEWIEPIEDTGHSAVYFVNSFSLDTLPERAVLYHSGIGLDKAYINGISLSSDRLQPAFTNYKKECQYVTDIIDVGDLKIGENVLGIAVGGGWRKNYGEYLDNLSAEREIEFLGNIALNAQLVLYFKDKTEKIIATDESFRYLSGAITYSHLFNGETYDEYEEKQNWNTNYFNYENKPVKKSDFNTEKFISQNIEPVKEKRRIKPVCEYFTNGKRILDFGENLAGIVALSVEGECRGKVTFRIRHAELLNEKGELFTEPLRGAKAEDTFILKEGYHSNCYTPEFTYHGFRYAEISTEGDFDGKISAEAISIYTDIDADNHFKCSDMTVNEFYNCVIRTERANLHSIASDCPQRDERMGWLNDATVRFCAQKYNFMPVKLYEKFVADVANEQDAEGRITCTAPFVYGEKPADPVCSSFLIAAREHYLITGSTSLIEKYYDNFARWNEYLKTRREDGIVTYSYYGDWAGPDDCCYNAQFIGDSDKERVEGYEPGAANSLYVPGEFISTTCHFMNYKMLSEFASLTGKEDDRVKFENEAKIVKEAFLKKWYKGSGVVHNGSQACQALALGMGLIDKEDEEAVARVMNKAVADAGYRIQTANISTPMLLKMLMKFGYKDTAWKLLKRTEYPSWGYMIANGATTVWERFELKESCGMNSHSHPMYGASVGALYEGVAGLGIITPGYEYSLEPFIPEGVNFFEVKIPTLRGTIYVKAEDKYNKKTVSVFVPFGVSVTLKTSEGTKKLSSGYHTQSL